MGSLPVGRYRSIIMYKKPLLILPLFALLTTLNGCTSVGEKSADLSVIYYVTAVLSVMLLVGYLTCRKGRSAWFVVLFTSVAIVNVGYLWLALSRTLESALWANRLSYLGSVYLPIATLMIVLNTTGIKYSKYIPIAALTIASIMFIITASPGFSTVYYKEVSHSIIDGVASLKKVYGPLHRLYLYYLIATFGSMLAVSGYAIAKKKLVSTAQTVFLLIAVLVNLGVWLIEQLVVINFEMLSVSYIITELFLIALNVLVSENERLRANREDITEVKVEAKPKIKSRTADITVTDEMVCSYTEGLGTLTKTERIVYDMYISGSSTKEIMGQLCITENTLKYHNKNIYGKLGVSSRKQLLTIAEHINSTDK